MTIHPRTSALFDNGRCKGAAGPSGRQCLFDAQVTNPKHAGYCAGHQEDPDGPCDIEAQGRNQQLYGIITAHGDGTMTRHYPAQSRGEQDESLLRADMDAGQSEQPGGRAADRSDAQHVRRGVRERGAATAAGGVHGTARLGGADTGAGRQGAGVPGTGEPGTPADTGVALWQPGQHPPDDRLGEGIHDAPLPLGMAAIKPPKRDVILIDVSKVVAPEAPQRTNWRGEPGERCYNCGGVSTTPVDDTTRECEHCGEYALEPGMIRSGVTTLITAKDRDRTLAVIDAALEQLTPADIEQAIEKVATVGKPTHFLVPEKAAEELGTLDELHPNGRCLCAGEGMCRWCRTTCPECGSPGRKIEKHREGEHWACLAQCGTDCLAIWGHDSKGTFHHTSAAVRELVEFTNPAREARPLPAGPRRLVDVDYVGGDVQLSNKGCPRYYVAPQDYRDPEDLEASEKRCGCPKGECWYDAQLERRSRSQLALRDDAWRALISGEATEGGDSD